MGDDHHASLGFLVLALKRGKVKLAVEPDRRDSGGGRIGVREVLLVAGRLQRLPRAAVQHLCGIRIIPVVELQAEGIVNVKRCLSSLSSRSPKRLPRQPLSGQEG